MSEIDLIQSRRSVRAFQPREIPDALLSEILQISARAPTGGNLQSYSVIVTREQKRRHELYEIHFRQEMLLQAPVILTICADVSRNSRWMTLRGSKPGFENFWGFLIGMADSWSFAQNVSLSAHGHGLGSCHSGSTFQKALNLIEFFQCPAGVIPVATLAIGYPAKSPVEGKSLRPRLDMKSLVHEERYRSLNPAELDQTFARKERSELEYYQRYYGNLPSDIRSLAEIYARVKYPKSDMDLFGENYLTALRKQGFIRNGKP